MPASKHFETAVLGGGGTLGWNFTGHLQVLGGRRRRSEQSRFESWPGTLCSWARHLTLTVPLSTQEYKWVLAYCWGNLTNCWEVTCDGLASRPGGVEILLAASCYKNRDKLQQLWVSLGSKASLTGTYQYLTWSAWRQRSVFEVSFSTVSSWRQYQGYLSYLLYRYQSVILQSR